MCKRFRSLLEELESKRWEACLTLDNIRFKWVGLVNAAAFHHLRSHEWQHLNPRAPISPFVTRNPAKPTAFFRLVVLETLEEARDRKVPLLRFFHATRAVLCKVGLHQEKALVSVTWQDSQLVYSATSVGNGSTLVSGAVMNTTMGTLGIDNPLMGPRLDRRRVDLCGTYIAPTDIKVDLSYLLIDPLVKRLSVATDKHWYSVNPTRRFYPEDQRQRELTLAGIDDPDDLGEEAWLITKDWPKGSYKLLLAVLVPGQKISLVIHRHG